MYYYTRLYYQIMLYDVVLVIVYCIILCCMTMLYSSLFNAILSYSTLSYSIILYSIILYYVTLHYLHSVCIYTRYTIYIFDAIRFCTVKLFLSRLVPRFCRRSKRKDALEREVTRFSCFQPFSLNLRATSQKVEQTLLDIQESYNIL